MIHASRGPLVSVLTTVYNAEAFIETTLRSLLSQTHEHFESIVVDDGSVDSSAEKVAAIAAEDARVRLIRTENRGYSQAANLALAEARGEFVAFLDHDDLWHPHKLERQLQPFEVDPAVGMVGCYSALIDEDHLCSGWRFGTPASGAVYEAMRFCDLVAGGSVPLVRRELLEQVGGFDAAPEVQGRSDWDLWLRVSRHCRYVTIEQNLVGYVRRSESYSRDYQRMIRSGAEVLSRTSAGDSDLRGAKLHRARARDAFGIFCLAMADDKLPQAGAILRQSLSISTWPVLTSPARWGVVGLYVLARCLPDPAYQAIWRRVAHAMFGIRVGTPFFLDDERSGSG